MRATEELVTEHGAIKRMLRIIDEVSRRLDAGEPVATEDLEGIVEFIRVFADKCHHAKEEGHLFPAMVQRGVPAESGPIGVMLYEHDLGREHVRAMGEALAGAARGERAAAQAFSEHARGYAGLLRDHIAKEDSILYPMAERVLDSAEDDRLFEAFERVETDVVGQGRHEEFHRMLDRLEETYLGKTAAAH